MAYELNADYFMTAFYRMANRRGFPDEMISDNETNFVLVDGELRELIELLDRDKN